MMKQSMINIVLTAVLLVLLPKPIFAEPIEKIRFVKLSPSEQQAVIKTSDGKLKVVKVGDTVADDSKITEISKDRILLERNTKIGAEKIIITLHNGTQKIRMVSKAAPDIKSLLPQGDSAVQKLR